MPLDAQRGRKSSTPRSETESSDSSYGDLSDLTLCNASPSLSQRLPRADVWYDFVFLGDPRLTEKIKFVLEIQENVENYVDKKDSTMEVHQKLLSLGEQIDRSNNLESDQVELCRFMYKLNFQQLLLLESYNKLLQLLSTTTTTSSCINNLSSEVNALRHSLLNTLCGEEEYPRTPTPTCNSETKDSCAKSMVLHPTPPREFYNYQELRWF